VRHGWNQEKTNPSRATSAKTFDTFQAHNGVCWVSSLEYTDLVFIDCGRRKISGSYDQEMLLKHLLLDIRFVFGEFSIFQQDSVP